MHKFLLCMFFVNIAYLSQSQKIISWKYLDSIADNHMQSFTFKQLSDTTLKVWYVQETKPTKQPKRPAIIWIHGGAWVGGKANTFFTNAAYCNLNGTVGFSIEYRLLNKPNYSVADCINDCAEAITAIKQQHQKFNIDTNKIILVGESAGGHLAAMIALQKKHNLKALILYNPVLNCNTGTFIKYMHAPLLLNKLELDTTKLLATYQKTAISRSPLYLVKNKIAPTLIIQGLEDKITPPQYAIDFKDSLLSKKTKCTIELLAKANHAFAIPHYKASEEQVISALNSLTTFLIKQKIIKQLNVAVSNSYSNTWYNRK